MNPFAGAMALTYAITALGYFLLLLAALISTVEPGKAARAAAFSFLLVFTSTAARQWIREQI
jgi:hypothetical protein